MRSVVVRAARVRARGHALGACALVAVLAGAIGAIAIPAAAAPAAATTAPPAAAAPAAAAPRPLPQQVDPRIADGTAQRRLDGARERWRQLAADAYRMRLRVTCFCAYETVRPRTLVVRRGRPIGPVPAHLRRFATVPRQFARIQEAIDARVAALTVSYRPSGRPRMISIDRSRMVIDEEIGLAVDRFRRLRR